jgi:hypothetical protein
MKNVRLLGSPFITQSIHPRSTLNAVQWQIEGETGDFTAPLFDTGWVVTTQTYLDTQLEDGYYRARLRYRDTLLEESDWSDPTAFRIETPVTQPLDVLEKLRLDELRLGPLRSSGDFATAATDTENKINQIIRSVREIRDDFDSIDAIVVMQPDATFDEAQYYTKEQVDALVLGKADLTHSHDERYYTKDEIDGIVGSSNQADLVWVSVDAQVANARQANGELRTVGEDTVIANDGVDIELLVSDNVLEYDASASAVLEAGTVGSFLAGTGTARAIVRTDAAGAFSVIVRSVAGFYYLWAKQGGNTRLFAKARATPFEVQLV